MSSQLMEPETILSPEPVVQPTFILGGAPKSGTTSMANYLRTHPQVFFSDPKEPFYWATDLPALRRRERIESPTDYAGLFRTADSKHAAIGEGSTLYLYSKTAIENIVAASPDTKFIFMLRRPDEIAHAFHMQMRFHFFEDIESFPVAWQLQTQRAAGKAIPAGCLEPAMLQYQAIASIGSQLQRAMQVIPTENLLVLLFDDFRDSPASCYRQILSFLGLTDDGRQVFERQNAAMQPRAAWLTKLLRSPFAKAATRLGKQTLRGPAYQVADRAKKWLSQRRQQRVELPADFRQELIDQFIPEVELLEELLDRDLSHWKQNH